VALDDDGGSMNYGTRRSRMAATYEGTNFRSLKEGGCIRSAITPQVMAPLRSLADAAALRRAADAYLAGCFTRQTPPRASELAANLGLSAHHLSRTFRALVGRKLSEYLKDAQIAHAKQLLRSTALPMNEIAYAAGFGTRTTFFRAFRRATGGLTPAQYRETSNIK
jgi:AraC-like DNA-binding protein